MDYSNMTGFDLFGMPFRRTPAGLTPEVQAFLDSWEKQVLSRLDIAE